MWNQERPQNPNDVVCDLPPQHTPWWSSALVLVDRKNCEKAAKHSAAHLLTDPSSAPGYSHRAEASNANTDGEPGSQFRVGFRVYRV